MLKFVVRLWYSAKRGAKWAANKTVNFFKSAWGFAKEHPVLTAFCVVCVAATIALAVTTGPGCLLSLGFGPGGIVAGSTAAAWQASLGSVAAGSLFALLQSAGALGAGVAVLATVVEIAACICAAVVAVAGVVAMKCKH